MADLRLHHHLLDALDDARILAQHRGDCEDAELYLKLYDEMREGMDYDRLIDAVTAKTKGTKGDPLTREEVEQVVRATINELAEAGAIEMPAEPTSQHLSGGGGIPAPEQTEG